MVDAETIREFRLLLRSYIDLAREDWSDDVAIDQLRDVIAYATERPAALDALREVALCVLLDPEGTQEEMLSALDAISAWPELEQELAAYFLRRPRSSRQGQFRDLAQKLGVASGRAADKGANERTEEDV